MSKRIVSLLLSFVMLLSCISCLSAVTFSASEVDVAPVQLSQNQLNIVDRANYMYNTTWVCKKTVAGWGGTFYQGSTYRIPYGQPVNTGKYVGFEKFGASRDEFLAAAADPNSVHYTKRSTYNKESTYYCNDCSAFVSYAWGISRNTTSSLGSKSTNLGKATESNIRANLQLGDALNYAGSHVVLVTGITYSGNTMTQVEITEQTPPQIKRSYYSPSALASKYSSKYSILRYTGTVAPSPGGSTTTQHPLESNPTHQKLKNIVFDAGFYYSRYEDVRNAIGLDGDKLYEHFLNNGIKEGRCGSPYFDVKWYMTKNDQGLIDHCNGDYMKAYEHFLDYVEEPSEMTGTPKKLSPVLDINYYKNNYSDLRNTGWTTEYQYLTHFVNSGVNEFRQGSAEFDPVSYAYFNDDVRNAYGTENKDKYYFHYMAYGINETDMAGRKRIADYENYGKTFYATISEINTGKVLEYIPDASVSGFSDNNAVQINTSNGSDEQLWKFERNEDGTYKVINVKYNKYLNGSATFLGATDKITDANEVFQNWKIMNKNGNCVLKVGAGNRVVDNAVSTDNYSAVKIWDFNGNPNQQFRINIIGENYGEKFRAQINTVVHGAFVLSPNENGSIVVNANDGADDKYWDFERQSDGSYKIKHVATGKVLDVQGGLTKNYTDIALYEDNGTAAQRWLIVAEPFNSISLRPVCGLDANVALDLNGKGAGSQLSNGDNISIYEYLGSDGQRFEIKKVAVNVGLLGDVNNDGTVSIMDATTVQLSIASLCTLTENETLRADVDSNKNIDIMDATAIQRYLVQYAVGYPIGQSLEIIG